MAKKKATAKAVEEVKENVELETPEIIEDPRKEEAEKPTQKVKVKSDVIGKLKGGKEVHQPGQHLKVKSVRAPISKSELPKDLQRWLTNKGYGTNVYLESKEWLERHHVDMSKIEELKKFINDRYL